MIVDHIGIAVRSITDGLAHWKTVFGYSQATEVATNTRQKVRVVFLSKPGSIDIKLIEPSDESSPIHRFAARGGGLHHLCFRCADLDSELCRMSAAGCTVLVPPQPGEAFANQPIAFIYANGGLNIELIATELRAGRMTAPGMSATTE